MIWPIWRPLSHCSLNFLQNGSTSNCSKMVYLSTLLEYFSDGQGKAIQESPDESELWPNQHFSSAAHRSHQTRQHTFSDASSSVVFCIEKHRSLYIETCLLLLSYMGDSTAVHLAPSATTIPKPAGRPIAFDYHLFLSTERHPFFCHLWLRSFLGSNGNLSFKLDEYCQWKAPERQYPYLTVI